MLGVSNTGSITVVNSQQKIDVVDIKTEEPKTEKSKILQSDMSGIKNTAASFPQRFGAIGVAVKNVFALFLRAIGYNTQSTQQDGSKVSNHTYNSQQFSIKTTGERFKNIETNTKSQICIFGENEEGVIEKIGLPANKIFLGNGQKLARCQYPVSTDRDMSNHFRMILQEKPTEIVVLASDSDLNKGLTAYFRNKANYQHFEVESTLKGSQKIGDAEIKTYIMVITDKNDNKKHSITVKHMTNWPDFGVINAKDLLDFADKVENNALIHCRAGVGRTGVLIAAKQLLIMHKEEHLGKLSQQERERLVNKIITDMRNDASKNLVQGDKFDENKKMIAGQQRRLLYQAADMLALEGKEQYGIDSTTSENIWGILGQTKPELAS